MISLPVGLHGPMFFFGGSPWTETPPPADPPPAPDPLLECIIVLHWFGVDHLVYESNRLQSFPHCMTAGLSLALFSSSENMLR